MNWQDICDNPLFKDFSFKFETDRWGHIVMSPATNKHSWLQGEILSLLRRHLPNGRVLPKCSIQTSEGVKVADVVWASPEFFARHGLTHPYPEAPEIVIEVLSPSDGLAEMEEKKELYFARAAREFWVCRDNGEMLLYNNHARLERSSLAPDFPTRIELPA
jgi:Uma2 family endonuclease